MADHGITVDNVWKKFHRGELHDSLRDLVPALAKRLVGRGPKREELDEGDFWALKNVSFEVRPGEAMGIIGPNGAGKSTMLKILNRVLKPNRGTMEVRGRVGALIETSAGFHPDLTGRENVYLQGAIMGMRSAETAQKFDKIVEFSGIGEFIDTPVKRYSSGMNARLGFSIAAHLEPDVLLVDEVLSVGDFHFQKRAFARLQELLSGNMAVIVVSHQLDRIAELCDRAVLLRRGEIAHAGPARECIAAYLTGQESEQEGVTGQSPIAIRSIRNLTEGPVPSGGWLKLEVSGSIVPPYDEERAGLSVRIRSPHETYQLYATGPNRHGIELPNEGDFKLVAEFQMNVANGLYVADAVVWDKK
ncbi:MAG: ABC transporter ATP-binding protein, partial [Vicinamibacteria bacterium]